MQERDRVGQQGLVPKPWRCRSLTARIALLSLVTVLTLSVAAVILYRHYRLPTSSFDLSALSELRQGDLVFRHGNTGDSVFISAVSQFKYSHVGVLVETDPPTILHASPADAFNPRDEVSLISLEDFLAAATDFGVARVSFLDEQGTAQFIEGLQQQLGLPFVLKSKNQPHRYCTSVIADELNRITPFSPPYQHLNVYFTRGDYLFVSALWQHQDIHIIYEHN